LPFCQRCGAEYRDGVTFCSDCQIELQLGDTNNADNTACLNCGSLNEPGLEYCWNCGSYLQAVNLENIPFAFQGDVMQCWNCGRDTPLGIEYCIQCGYLLSNSSQCFNHPDSKTRFICLVCKKPICRKCSREVNQKLFCHDCADYQFIGNWAVIFSGESEQELLPLQKKLEETGIYALIGNRGTFIKPWILGMFSQGFENDDSGRFKILVPIVQVKDAEQILIELEFVYENICSNCRYQFNGNSVRCPNCGEEFL